jgi:outer membrane protein
VKNFFQFASFIALAAGGLSLGTAWSQTREPGQPKATAKPAGSESAQPHMVGLIDMAHVFKNYKKFESLRDELKVKITASEEHAKQMATSIKQLQEEMKSLKETSSDYTEKESQLASATADFEAFRRATQREILKEESAIYHIVYMEVADAVRRYSNHYGYTLVLRFNREDLNPDDPQGLIQGMNRQVVFYRLEDDMTESVLDHLNKKWDASQQKSEAAAPRRGARQ